MNYSPEEQEKILAYYNEQRWIGIANKYRISIKKAKKEYTPATECNYEVWGKMAGMRGRA